ncbi:hypothetical protein M5689_012801 [Euphorbia peplus]|nr:hypothetical protein M5689_012801 [Euphorbia peplus]
MEAILARALEYTLKYWLKSFSRDQFKLQGRTVQLSNLDINGDALHASMGFPPALNVTKAKVAKFQIILPYVSNVQVEPIIVQIDKLDIVLEENNDLHPSPNPNSAQSSAPSTGYGFADKIADGMTVQITTVNLLLETRGGLRREGGAAWAAPLASITIRNLFLYTTNENWQVVNLKEARDFSNGKGFIYVFKKLEWESLSIDLLPHPDMFTDASIARTQEGVTQRDDDGAKRVFFGGERFLEGISGEAHITLQRTELNSPLGLEVQLHITEAVCPALSEPGLRALLRFLTGLYVCLNRGDVDLKAQQRSTEAAGCSIVSILVDHIFFCIKDAEFQLELLMQSLFFSRATVSGGEIAKTLTRVLVGGFFLRDTFSRPPCTLVQPLMEAVKENVMQIPDFAKDFCPPIYPLGEEQWQLSVGVPLIGLHSLQVQPSPVPPSFASETVIACQPLMFHLQEESCLRISSFLADGIVVNPGDVLPDFSVNSFMLVLKELDVTVPLDMRESDIESHFKNSTIKNSFVGARLHIENLFFSESPSLKLRLLNLEKDPACFCLWKGQPIDASQKKWTAGASHVDLSLETSSCSFRQLSSSGSTSGYWRCVELKDASVEVAMVTADGSPLTNVPPPGGVVRVGVACQQYFSNTSVEQLFFVLDLYAYFGRVGEKISLVSKQKRSNISTDDSTMLMDKVPCDTAASLALKGLQLRFLESSDIVIEGMPLVQFIGDDLFVKVAHRTLGGAIAVSSTVCWQSVQIDCVETDGSLMHENSMILTSAENDGLVSANGHPQLRAVFWVHNQKIHKPTGTIQAIPFLDISIVHVIPFSELDKECHSLSVTACISGIRLGGGMNYAEALLHRFGILGPDGGPGEGVTKGLKNLSTGPLSKLFKTSALTVNHSKADISSENGKDGELLHLGMPDDVDVSVELKDWLFALEGAQDMAERFWFSNQHDVGREERCWHTTFDSLLMKAKNGPGNGLNGKGKSLGRLKYPVELVSVGVEGLQILKPKAERGISLPNNGTVQVEACGGINLEVRMVMSEESVENEMATWAVENLKFSVKEPIEAVVTNDELQHLALLCKSEVDAMGRIAAGILKLLKLERSIGQTTIDQLNNLGSESFDKIFSSPKPSRGSSPCSIGFSPMNNDILQTTAEATVVSLEEAISDTQVKFADLTTRLSASESSVQYVADIKQLSEKLEHMQNLVRKLHQI